MKDTLSSSIGLRYRRGFLLIISLLAVSLLLSACTIENKTITTPVDKDPKGITYKEIADIYNKQDLKTLPKLPAFEKLRVANEGELLRYQYLYFKPAVGKSLRFDISFYGVEHTDKIVGAAYFVDSSQLGYEGILPLVNAFSPKHAQDILDNLGLHDSSNKVSKTSYTAVDGFHYSYVNDGETINLFITTDGYSPKSV